MLKGYALGRARFSERERFIKSSTFPEDDREASSSAVRLNPTTTPF
jgi:hypothetical protein